MDILNIISDKKTHSPQLLAACWPMDPHFPLPGNVGIDYTQFAEENNSEKQKETQKTLANAFLDVEPEDYRKQLVINQFLDEKFKEEIQAALEVCFTISFQISLTQFQYCVMLPL